MMTIKEMLDMGADTLHKACVNEYKLDAWYLLSYYLGINKSEYYMRMNESVDDLKVAEYMSYISRRAEHEPLQYITGEQEFYGLLFKVNENVLIPRQDTEVLVEYVIGISQGRTVLDMCTGSGCIAVSIAKCGNAAAVSASDISEDALKVAEYNAKNNQADIEFIHSDIWENITGSYDILVSNPPYITDEEMEELDAEVYAHEPHLALRGGCDGLVCYRKILNGIDGHINDNGVICFEIGCSQAKDIIGLMEENNLSDIHVIKDLAGLDRVVWGRYKAVEV
ncbi:MAG: peptide chain release factor N(5)-glutamine methyltransferase [Lachnospiraceae bacterium]|nr:peptide chain release factor N(5)-glutamine methyltransferase [Lachnospiraceae bacterium]